MCLLNTCAKIESRISDVVQVLGCVNIKSPDRRVLQRRFNQLSDMMVDVNKQRMIDNKTYVKHILQLAGEENPVNVETNSSYNKRPQPSCEVATQTFCPLFEQSTTKKLTINIGTANVNCKYINKIGKKDKILQKARVIAILFFNSFFHDISHIRVLN